MTFTCTPSKWSIHTFSAACTGPPETSWRVSRSDGTYVFLQWVLLAPGLSSQVDILRIPTKGAVPWSHLHMPEPLQLSPFNTKERQFCSEIPFSLLSELLGVSLTPCPPGLVQPAQPPHSFERRWWWRRGLWPKTTKSPLKKVEPGSTFATSPGKALRWPI